MFGLVYVQVGSCRVFPLLIAPQVEHSGVLHILMSFSGMLQPLVLRWKSQVFATGRLTAKRGLRQVNFIFDGNDIRGLEQNPETKSRWDQLARSGKKVMQFLSEGRYVANVVDGKVTLYGRRVREAQGCPAATSSFSSE